MMRFVIVDDDKAAANALAKKLAAYDETELCGIAMNGLDGLRMINETRPDVLFLDIELPDISGIEFLEHVNCLPQYKCRTVMYTTHDRFMLSAFRNKAFDYLMKPIDDTELRVWELTLAHQKTPIRLKRNVNSDMLLALNSQLVRVSQKHIINIGYLMEVTNNTCRFYPPFDKVEDVKVGRLFRKKLIDQFCNL